MRAGRVFLGRDPQQTLIEHAMAMARVRALRVALLDLHKTLIDTERLRYERAHGPIDNAHAALKLVLEDPWFRWLAPLAAAIVQIDERLADGVPIEAADVEAFARRARVLLQRESGDPVFHAEYRRALQDTPEIVVAHGRVAQLIAGFGAGAAEV